MPKTFASEEIKSAFENVQARHAFPVDFKLFYKRRYWDTGTSKYIWEASWQEVEKPDIKSFSVINQKLDTVQLNQLLSSNVSPTLSNEHHVWEEGYNWSKFNADGTATDGYIPYLTKIQIRGGLVLDDGTSELLNLFTGYAVKFLTSSKNNTIRLTSEGRERILKDADAEKVNEGEINNEALTGTINGVNKVFTTTNNGVGRVTEVLVDTVEYIVGKDCAVSNLNKADLPATITINDDKDAPSSTMTGDYFYWKQNQRFEDLVVDLLQEAGLTAGDYDVDPVVFPNDVLNVWEQTSKADWDSRQSQSETENATSPGDVKLKHDVKITNGGFETGDFTNWTISGTTNPTVESNDFGIYEGAYSARWYKPFPSSGIMHVTIRILKASDNSVLAEHRALVNLAWEIRFISHTASPGVNKKIEIYWESAAGGWGKIRSIDVGDISFARCYTRRRSNEINSSDTVYVDFITAWLSNIGNIVTQQLDTLVGNPDSWNLLDYTVTVPGGTSMSFETISSTTSGYPGDGHADWIAISGNRQINSAAKQYLWARANFVGTNSATPILHDLTVNYSTSTTVIALANFTGQSVFDAISEFAKMPDYEMGFDSEEKFFFRQKSTSLTPDFTFNESDGLIEVISRYEDVSRLYNWIRVTYGAYTKDVTPITEGDSQPNSFDKYGKRKLTISGGQIVVSESADIATGIAQTFFERYKLPRIFMQIKIKYYPQINLSDVVKVKFDPKRELERIKWDDGVSYWDDGVLRWDGFRAQIIDYLTCKVVGIGYNIDRSDVTLDLEEIL